MTQADQEHVSTERTPFVLVSVGTDHHPFDRLIRWVDGWLASRAAGTVRCFVQSGTSHPPHHAEWAKLVSHERMADLMRSADVVISHGGPGTIMGARRCGKTPIVVPRRATLGEHVDDHQVRFAKRLAASGQVRLVEDEAGFREAVDSALAYPTPRPQTASERVPQGAGGLAKAVTELLGPRARTQLAGDPPRRVDVLYVGGWGRSGSTLLDRLLGAVPGFIPVGELREVWLRGCIENRLCGCGRRFLDCPFWERVGTEAFGGWDRADPVSLQVVRRRYDRPWTLPLLAAARRTPRAEGLDRYVAALSKLYTAIRDVSGGQVIVDSGKIPSHAFLLALVPNLNVRVIHLVRDPRGVAYSWQKRVHRTDGGKADDYMARYGPMSAALRYDLYNSQTHLLRWVGIPYRFLRYEDLVAHPHAALRSLAAFGGASADAASDVIPVLAQGDMDMGISHTVDGNPSRLRAGGLSIRADEEWRVMLPTWQHRLVTVLTAPLLLRYRYRFARDR